jgi:filamentous hemagglutinin family protein
VKKQILMNSSHYDHRLRPVALALAAAGIMNLAHAAPQDGVVRAGSATISGGGAQTRIDQSTSRAIIDWRSFSIGAGEQVQFVQPSASSAILNRVTGSQVSTLLGKLDANGQVLLVNPNGIVIGKGGQINVAGFIASTSNISNTNFMSGRLIFDQPGKAGAGILSSGNITAAEGGLVALVAPHVRNDGLIQARLGKVILGAADTFTIDLYGDQLVNLALSDTHIGQLYDANGQPVQSLITQAGRIDAGQTVLVTAATARNVLDNLINMSGTIKAETAVQDGGRIVLMGEGGKVNVSGTLDASGNKGGQIEVLGQNINIASSASLNANGTNGGGTIHVGGTWQGSGTTYRARDTTVKAGANLTASALTNGNGGEVVVWSDGHTAFAGNVEAKGGAQAGNGGRMEVSGKNTLTFSGTANASAPNGTNGSLLLDPAYLDITAADAGVISRVIRTGTSATLQADVDINVNAAIDGRGYLSGGGITMTAGNNININDFVITNNGAINFTTGTGGVNVATGKVVYAGNAPITVSAGGNLSTGPLLTSGLLTLISRSGSIAVDSLIDSANGPVNINASGDVDINQPIISIANGSPLTVSAGNDIRVNSQIDGRGGAAGGTVSLAATRNLQINNYILTNNGAININAGGSIAMAPSTALFTGAAPISITGVGNVTTSPLLSTGAITASSSGGSLAFGGVAYDGTSGPITLSAAGAVDINQPIANVRSNAPLNVNAGGNININAQIDGRDGNTAAPSGTVTMTAGQNINLNKSIVTDSAAINLTAQAGTLVTGAGNGLFADAGPIALTTGASVTTGPIVTTGSVNVRSTAGSINMSTSFSDPAVLAGPLTFNAAQNIDINQPIANFRSDAPLSITAGGNININNKIDGRDANAASPSGSVTLLAGQNINLNQSIATENAALTLTATAGTITTAPTMGLFSGNAPLSVTSGATLSNGILSTTGALNIRSTAGGVNIVTPIADTVGAVAINAATTVNIDQPITNIKTGNALTVTAGTDINVNAQIDGRGGVAGGSVTMTAGNNLNLNEHITTNDGIANLTTTTGSVVLASTKQVRTGSASINIVSGGDFSTGAAPPAVPDPGAPFATYEDMLAYVSNFLKDYVQLVTTGALNITSTNGAVNVDAPIPDTTGAVTINGNTINVRQHINSNNQPITLNAGTGGITISTVSDLCGSGQCIDAAAVDARNANLTLNSVGNVSIANSEIATTKILTIDTRGTLTGSVGPSQIPGVGVDTTPQKIILTADGGIPDFAAILIKIDEISATSSNGSITLSVFEPDKLRITTGCTTCDINTGNFVGPDVVLNAGGTINAESIVWLGASGSVTLLAGKDVNLRGSNTFSDATAFNASNLTVVAGGNVNMGTDLYSTIWLRNGPLSITAGGNITTTANSPIHISNGASLTFTAGGNLTLNLLETLGPVSLTATTGSMTLNNPIGPHIINLTGEPDFNPSDLGVAALSLSAPTGSITMQGARAEGNVVISTGGTLTAAQQITSVGGTVSITAAGGATLSAVPIGSQDQLRTPSVVTPIGPPGPLVPPPGAPGIVSFGAPGLPAFPDIIVAGTPGGTGGTVDLPGSPLAGILGLPPTGAGESSTDTTEAQRAAQQQNGNSEPSEESSSIVVADGSIVFTGRGLQGLQESPPCPPGAAPGTPVATKDSSGKEVSVACK